MTPGKGIVIVSIIAALCGPAMGQTYTASTVVTGNLSAGGIAVDSAGNIYYANLQAVQKMTPAGAVSTYAGSIFGLTQSTGDGGPATSASFRSIGRLSIDSQDNVYIHDYDRIRKIAAATGVITTVAGAGATNGPPPGSSSAASLNLDAGGNPVNYGMALDAAGNIFTGFSDLWVLKISGGTAALIAGSGGLSTLPPGDGGAALAAPLVNVLGIAVDGSGNVYLAESGRARIRKFAPGGTISTVAGSGSLPGFSGDGGAATSALLFDPTDVALDASGNLYIADADNNRIRKVSGGVITTIAGGGTNSSTSFVGPATNLKLNAPVAIAIAGDGTVYLTGFAGNVVKLTPGAALPAVNAGGVVGGASFSSSLAPAGITSLFGLNFSNGNNSATTVPLPTTLGGVTVQLNGIAAPLFFVGPGQINFQIPWELLGQASATLTVTNAAGTSAAVTITLSGVAPGIFTLDSSGKGQGAIQLANTSTFAAGANSVAGASAQPVSRGNYVTIYCSGLGAVSNQPATGAAAPGNPLASATASVTATIGGQSAPVTFAGLAPAFVGLYQVNAQVPQGVAPGNAVAVVLTVNGVASNSVTIAVQ